MIPTGAVLERAARRLVSRLEKLEARLDGGDDGAWSAFIETTQGLALILGLAAPERRGVLLTTQEMAERLGINPKTLLKHKAKGVVEPALQRGKLIRWRGDELR